MITVILQNHTHHTNSFHVERQLKNDKILCDVFSYYVPIYHGHVERSRE